MHTKWAFVVSLFELLLADEKRQIVEDIPLEKWIAETQITRHHRQRTPGYRYSLASSNGQCLLHMSQCLGLFNCPRVSVGRSKEGQKRQEEEEIVNRRLSLSRPLDTFVCVVNVINIRYSISPTPSRDGLEFSVLRVSYFSYRREWTTSHYQLIMM